MKERNPKLASISIEELYDELNARGEMVLASVGKDQIKDEIEVLGIEASKVDIDNAMPEILDEIFDSEDIGLKDTDWDIVDEIILDHLGG